MFRIFLSRTQNSNIFVLGNNVIIPLDLISTAELSPADLLVQKVDKGF